MVRKRHIGTYMVAVNAVVHFAMLATGTRVEPSEIGYGHFLLF
jgi:hypothetical protein